MAIRWRRLLTSGRLVRYYAHRAYARHLLATNTFTCCVLMTVGDSVQQKYNTPEGQHGHDWPRTRRMFTIGLAIGPLTHFWYRWLDWYLPARTLRVVLHKIVLDQLVCSPACILTFIGGMSALEGKTVRECGAELTAKFGTVYFVSC